jgi:drug/metabolite transporter (DMT)-like permease
VLAALAVLAVVVAVRHPPGAGVLSGRGLHRHGMLLGATNVAGFLLLQNAGMRQAQVGIASVLIYTQPLLVALGASVLLRERLTTRQVVGLLAGWLGVALVVLGEVQHGLTPVRSVVLLLGAALCWTMGTLLFKSVPRDVPVWALLLWQNVYGLVPLTAIAVWSHARADWGVPLAVAVLWAGVGASIGGFGLQFVLLRRGKAGVVSSWIFAVPVIASALGVVVLHDKLQVGMVLGGVAVTAGIYLVNSRRRHPASVDAGSVTT